MKEIICSNGQITLVNNEDYDYLNQFSWSINSAGRVNRGTNKDGNILMHNEIIKRMGFIKNKCDEIDHIDNNPLNNQRNNLRISTKSQNQHNAKKRIDNTTGLKDVTYHKRLRKYQVRVQSYNKRNHIGYYKTLEEAIKARDEAIKEYHKEFGRLV